MSIKKDDRTERLRNLVLSFGEFTETDRADSGLTTLSFQSIRYPSRHVWVDTDLAGKLVIDLEDWDNNEAWDNSVDHLSAATIEVGSEVIGAWLSGKPTVICRQLCNQGERKKGT